MAYLWRSSLVQPIQFFERLTLGTNIASLRWRTLPERDDKEIVPMSEIESRVWSPVKTTLSRAIGIRVALSLVVIRYLPWIRTESLLSSAFIFFCIRHIKVTGFEPMALCTQNRCADQTALHLVSPPPGAYRSTRSMNTWTELAHPFGHRDARTNPRFQPLFFFFHNLHYTAFCLPLSLFF